MILPVYSQLSVMSSELACATPSRDMDGKRWPAIYVQALSGESSENCLSRS